MFLKYPISCKELPKILIKPIKNTNKIRKIAVLQQIRN